MANAQPPNGIVTPEAVVLEFDTAGAGSRCCAEGIDLLVQFVGLVAIVLAASAIGGFSGVGWFALVIVFVAFFLIIVGYPVLMETLWNGRTLGKAALGLRVVTEEGGPIRFRHAAIRGMSGLVEIWMLQGFPAMISVILSKKNQRVGDIFAGTLVLRERSASGQATALAFPPPLGYESYVGSLDVSALSTQQYGVVRTFLTRVFELTPGARGALALRLANPVALQLNHTPPQMIGPELFLACVASAYQLRHGGPMPWGAPAMAGAPGYYGGTPPGSYGGPAPAPGAGPVPGPPPGYGSPSGHGAPPPGYGSPSGHGAPPPGYGAPPPSYGPPAGYGAPSGHGSPGYGSFGSAPPAGYDRGGTNAFPGDPSYPGPESYGRSGSHLGDPPGRFGDHGSYGGGRDARLEQSGAPGSAAAFGRGALTEPPAARGTGPGPGGAAPPEPHDGE